MAVDVELPQPTEQERVLEWRFEELVRGGFEPVDAGDLAAARHVDLHEALGLLARGCPPRTATRILL